MMVALTNGEGQALVGGSKNLDADAYREVVGLNNHGVSLLQRGDYGKASRIFKQASRQMISAIQETSPSQESPSDESSALTETLASDHATNPKPFKCVRKNPDADGSNLSVLEESSTSCEVAPNTVSGVPATTAFFDSAEMLVFGRPLMMMHLPESVESLDPLRCTCQSSVIVYNLALTFHLYGTMCGGPRGKGILQSALDLFDMAARLAWIGIRVCPALVSPVLLVALYNMGRIYQELGYGEKAKECSHQLAIVLRTVRDQDEHAGYDYERLCLSLLSFTKNIEAAGAA